MTKNFLILIIPLFSFGQIDPTELCDSINITFTGTMPGNSETLITIQIATEYVSDYWFPYCGLILTNEMEDTIASEELETALNVYGLGPEVMEERTLTIWGTIDYPFSGTIHLVNHLFSGANPEIVCSWPIIINNLSFIELSKTKDLVKKIDLLGRESSNMRAILHIYDNGSVEKKYLIE